MNILDTNEMVRFAEAVLNMMQRDDEWSADTLDDIANLAVSLDLATSDDQGKFIRTGISQ